MEDTGGDNTMDNNSKYELVNEALENVSGGRDGFDFGPPKGQVDTVPTVLPVLLHPDARQEEENTNHNPGTVGRL